jgi:hypothetical protein
MSKGKYSPTVYSRNDKDEQFDKNCYGQTPAVWSQEVADSGVVYDEKTMFGDYDAEGFDSYGYSAFDKAGNYVGIGSGVDRNGYRETDYQVMSDDEFEDHR